MAVEQTFRVTTLNRYSFLNLGKEKPYFQQIEIDGRLLFAGNKQTDLAVHDIITKGDSFGGKELQYEIYQRMLFVINCMKKRCKELHYEIYQTASGKTLMYYITGQCLSNLTETETFRADYMVFSDETSENDPKTHHNLDIDYIQCLRNAISETAKTFYPDIPKEYSVS
jgi:hypothetical protein